MKKFGMFFQSRKAISFSLFNISRNTAKFSTQSTDGSLPSTSSIRTKDDLKKLLRLCVDKDMLPPLSVNANYKKVVAGEREVVEHNDKFKFECTACGTCCRIFPAQVMLDPHDLYLMSRSPLFVDENSYFMKKQKRKAEKSRESSADGRQDKIGVAAGTTSFLFHHMAHAFTFELGLFEKDQTTDGLQQDSYAKIAPVCWLAPDNEAHQCHFAVPSIQGLNAFLPDADSSNKGKRSGLKCSLGKDHQPTPCASYPLGELFNHGKQQFYALDTGGSCDGIGKGQERTVIQYQIGNNLIERRAEWEWYRSLATAVAERKFLAIAGLANPSNANSSNASESASGAMNLMFELFMQTWFDFDSTPYAPPKGYTSWEETKTSLESATSKICDIYSRHLSNAMTPNKFNTLIQELVDNRILPPQR